jgi:hypothetical protein
VAAAQVAGQAQAVTSPVTEKVCYNCGHFHDITGFTATNCGSCWNFGSIVLETDHCDAFISKQSPGTGPEPDTLKWQGEETTTKEQGSYCG